MVYNYSREVVQKRANCCMRLFLRSTFHNLWTQVSEVFFLESFHVSENSRKSVQPNMGSSDFGILVSIQKTFVSSRVTMFRFLFVQSWFCTDYRTLQITCVKTLLRSLIFPDGVILNSQHSLVRSFWSGHINFWSDTSAWLTLQLSDISVAWLNLQSTILNPNNNRNFWSAIGSNS